MPDDIQNETESNNQQPNGSSSSYRPPYSTCPNGQYIDEEVIDPLDYWRVLVKRKRMVLSLICTSILASVIISLLLPSIYRTEVVLAPVEEKENGRGSDIFRYFRGLESMTGIALGGGNYEINLAILKSRAFIKKVVEDNNLMPLLFPDEWDTKKNAWIETDPEMQPTLWDAYRLIDEILTVSTDKKNGLTTVTLEREDPNQATAWLTLFIETLNTHLKDQAIKEAEANITFMNQQIEETPLLEMKQTLYGVIAEQTRQIMLAKAQQYFAFKIIDPPETPDKKHKPKRRIIVVLSAFIATFMAFFLAFFLEYIEKQKSEYINRQNRR